MQDKRLYKEKYRFYDLFRILTGVIPEEVIAQRNADKSWAYGYDSEYDVIIISKDGTIGDIYEIENLLIALPKTPDISEIEGSDLPIKDQVWTRKELPAELKAYRSMYDEGGWRDSAPKQLKIDYEPYIHGEFHKRFYGHWFMNNGIPTYLVGQHYMYLQWSPIDTGYPQYWLASMISYYHWEACKADSRCYGQVKVKCRRSGWSNEASSDAVETGTINKNALVGITSKTGDDAKSFFSDKVVYKHRSLPFFFKPMQEGVTEPKKEYSFRAPATKITAKTKGVYSEEEALNSRINWKNTKNNSYDSEKQKLYISDEAGKWEKPEDILVHWRRVKPTLRTGVRIVGKCKMGTTVNPKNEGGDSFKRLYDESNPLIRLPNGETTSGLYQLFIRAEYNYDGYIDKYGYPVFQKPKVPVEGINGEMISKGAVDYFDEMVEALKNDPNGLNDFLRENPREISDAFREPSGQSPFNLANIYDQKAWNNMMVKAEKGGALVKRWESQASRYNFEWKDAKKDSTVILVPSIEGRFLISWIPPAEQQNQFWERNGKRGPMHTEWGTIGCDPYDISQTMDGRGSNGAIVGLSRGTHMGGAPYGVFFTYCDRPYDADVFFDDVIKACVFYGMPLLAERDKARLLYEMKNRGYRDFVMNRPDQDVKKLKGPDKELGGYPGGNNELAGDQVLLAANFTNFRLGYSPDDTYRPEGEYPEMPFNELLDDLEKFDPKNRNKSDLTIAFMAGLLGIQPKGFYAHKEANKLTTINIGLTPRNKRYELSS